MILSPNFCAYSSGGGVSVSVSKPTAPFVGSLKNSVVSIAADSDFGAITLEKAGEKCVRCKPNDADVTIQTYLEKVMLHLVYGVS